MNFVQALKNLQDALRGYKSFQPYTLSHKHQLEIADILLGNHLTFRYLLFTALLAKHTEPNVHMRSLQAGATLKGAYDARSLCHSVIVPFEKTVLEGRLGNSNEPFLNKPARFPTIDPSNPARAGRDRILLKRLSYLLEELNVACRESHREALFFALKKIFERDPKTVLSIDLPDIKLSFSKACDIIDKFLSLSHEGQSSVAVFGAITKTLHDKNRKILIHPTNQAGTSSNEIGDIDIIEKNQFLYAIEVKDKNFSENDVSHALEKVMVSGYSKLVFATGKNANWTFNTRELILREESRGFDLSFVEIASIAKNILAILSEKERVIFIKLIYEILIEMRAKDTVIKAYKALINL